MDRDRWSSATKAAKPSRLVSIEAWSTLVGVAAGAVLIATLSRYGLLWIVLGAVCGGLVGYILSIFGAWFLTYLRYPRIQLELRISQLENERRFAIPAAAAGPAPNLRPLIIAADEMLALPTANEADVTK